MVSFKTFTKKVSDAEGIELCTKVTTLFPTLVEHGIMIMNADGKNEFTNQGANAFDRLMRKTIFGDDIGNMGQDLIIEMYGLMHFDDDGKYSITNEGIYTTFAYFIYCGKTNEEIVGMLKEYWN